MSGLIAICLAGCEKEVIDDIKNIEKKNQHQNSGMNFSILPTPTFTNKATKLNNSIVFRGESGCGKLFIDNVVNFQFIDNIRSVQYWMVHIVNCNDMTTRKDNMSTYLEKLLTNVDLNAALLIWKAALSPEQLRKKAIDGKPKFCVRCIRDGEHEFSSMDVSMQIGGIVIEKTGWEVDLVHMDLEIIAFLLNECLVVGIHIPTRHSVPFLKSKLPSEIRHPVLPLKTAPSLRPSTAYTLIQLARPQPFDLVVDCMCGSGGGFVEAAFSHKCIGIGGDVDTDLRSTWQETLSLTKSMSQQRAVAQAMNWSAHKLPLRNASIDIVLLDLPFGQISKKTPKIYRAHVPKYLEEIARVLVPSTGRCVILSQTQQQLAVCLDSVYFTNLHFRVVNITGYLCYVATATRSEVAFRTPIRGTDTWEAVGEQEQSERLTGKKRPITDPAVSEST